MTFIVNPTGETYDRQLAQAYFVVAGITELVRLLVSAQIQAAAQGYLRVSTVCAELAQNISDDLNAIAAEMAALADREIVTKIGETRAPKRPQAYEMEGHIHSESTGLGTVAVALTDELDKIINPVGEYGPYWRAQEYGTGKRDDAGAEIPTQVGRVFLGMFEPSMTRPDKGQAGLGVGTDHGFLSGGADPGWGTISVDLPGRHFIRDGAEIAGAEYVRRMTELSVKYGERVRAASRLIDRTFTTGRGFTGIIQA